MRLTLSAALLSAASMLALPAYAKDDLVVTATRTPAAPERLAARIEVIDRADIETQGISTLSEAIGSTSVQAGGAGQQASLFLRGANSKHALALFDGIRLNDASTPNAQYDFGLDTLGALQRVEVLRGPASALYGSDAVGGVVNLIPRRGAESAFAPFAEASAGSFETYRALLGVAGSDGGWDFGVSGEWFSSAGHDLVPERIATHTGDRDGADIATITASARYSAGALGFDVLTRWRDSRTEFDTFSGGAFFDLRADDPDLENQAQQSIWRIGADYRLSESWSVRLSGGQVLSDRAEIDGGVRTSAADSERTFIDAQTAYVNGPTTLTTGVSFERNAIDTIPQFAGPLSADEDQLAAFATAQFDIAANVTATGSLRVDDYEAFGTHATSALGIAANLASLRVFASYGTAFKAPSLSERFETSMFNIGNPDLEPEQSRSWEIGADLALNDALRLGASYYQTRIDDLIEYNFFALQNVNVGEAEIDGAEAYIEARPAAWATLRLAYAWTDARNGLTGAPLARRPENAWRLDARLSPTPRLTLAASWSYVGERVDVTYSDAGAFLSGAGEVDGFSVGAVSATYAITDVIDVFARIDNVGDETYEQPAAFAGAPRSGLVGLRARF